MTEIGDNLGALKCFDKAIILNSEDADIFYSKGNALKQMGENKKAIE